jgi:uncharacterized protein YcaQ
LTEIANLVTLNRPAVIEHGPVYSALLEGVGIARQGVQEAWGQLKEVRTATEDFYQTGKAHTQGRTKSILEWFLDTRI